MKEAKLSTSNNGTKIPKGWDSPAGFSQREGEKGGDEGTSVREGGSWESARN